MNVLSLFDGISCGQVALQRAGIKYDKYFASEIDKHAITVTQKNHPNTIQLGSVVDVKAENLPKIELLLGGSPCFTAGHLVLTQNGHKPIEEVVVGDYVLTHKCRFRKVLRVGGKIAKTWLLRGSGPHSSIETTEDHPFWVKKMTRKWFPKPVKSMCRTFSEPEWAEAKALGKDWYWGIPTSESISDKSVYDYNFWYMIGRYTGDGWYGNSRRKNRKESFVYQFVVCCGHKDFEELKDKFDRFGRNYGFSKERTGVKFRICSQELVDFVRPIGKGASNKVIHPLLYNESVENIRAFLDGYIDSDGHTTKEGVIKISSTSKKLVYGIQFLVNKAFGRHSAIRKVSTKPTTIIEGRTVNQKDYYTIAFTKDTRKQDNSIHENGFSWMPIKNSVSSGVEKPVFNLEVEEDNSYTINNIAVHNCQGFSQAGTQLNFNHPQSKLYFEFLRLYRELKPKYFLLENVKMKPEYSQVISQDLGVEPILINSGSVSAQSRERLYWTNIPGITSPEDKKVMLVDVINQDYDGIWVWPRGVNLGGVKDYKGKSPSITTSSWQYNFYIYRDNGKEPKFSKNNLKIEGYIGTNYKTNRVYSPEGKSPCLIAQSGGKSGPANALILVKDKVRKFTINEVELLQTLPKDYTAGIPNGQRFKCVGNGWTVDVIAHLLKNLSSVVEH